MLPNELPTYTITDFGHKQKYAVLHVELLSYFTHHPT